MEPTLLAVTYRLRIPVEDFRANAEDAARQIAKARGLIWKIWGFNDETGEGTSFYLFSDPASAGSFANGPVIAALRDGPAEDVTIRITTIDKDLSTITGATLALSQAQAMIELTP